MMKNLLTTLSLMLAVLIGSTGVSYALPECPGSPNEGREFSEISKDWTDCSGIYTVGGTGAYNGEFKNGYMHGQGTLTFFKLDKYEGEFKFNKFDGQGTYIFANGTVKEGIWQTGIFQYTEPAKVGFDKWEENIAILKKTKACPYCYLYAAILDNLNLKGAMLKGANLRGVSLRGTDLQGANLVGADLLGAQFGMLNSPRIGNRVLAPAANLRGANLKGANLDKEGIAIARGTGAINIPEANVFVKKKSKLKPKVTAKRQPKKSKPRRTASRSTKSSKVYNAASGTGFAVTKSGYVITNNHVIKGCMKVQIHQKGKSIPATVVSRDKLNDLALLKGDFKPRKVFRLSRKAPELMEDIFVVGYPFGTKVSSSVKVTKGIVSSLTGIGNNFSNIQIDAAIQPGNSGGPIVNEKGNVIGVAVAKLSFKHVLKRFGTIPENTNFGIKTNVVMNLLQGNDVSVKGPNRGTMKKSDLGQIVSDATYYLSCWMTMAQIKKMRSDKVIFQDLQVD